MKAAGRQIKIRELLESREFVDLETLCRDLDASESSVRRDLIALESEGVLKRVYGGAMAVEARGARPGFRMAEPAHGGGKTAHRGAWPPAWWKTARR